jgi:hypothetical protein
MALFLPIPATLRWMLLGLGAIVLGLAFAIYALVRRGVLVSAARLAARIHLIAPQRVARWEPRLRRIDDKMKLVEGARVRDRRFGILMVTLSRLTSMTLSFLLLIAMGEKLTIGFVASVTVGSFFIYMVSTLVPMGIGINEGGYNMLFRALGENPARGTVLILARRVALIIYAAIGLVLVTASETVQRARERQVERAAASGQVPVLPEVRIVTAPAAPAPAAEIAD